MQNFEAQWQKWQSLVAIDLSTKFLFLCSQWPMIIVTEEINALGFTPLNSNPCLIYGEHNYYPLKERIFVNKLMNKSDKFSI